MAALKNWRSWFSDGYYDCLSCTPIKAKALGKTKLYFPLQKTKAQEESQSLLIPCNFLYILTYLTTYIYTFFFSYVNLKGFMYLIFRYWLDQVARLFGPAIFEASKLKVLFLGVDEKKHPGNLQRTYTLTHSDITSKLTLAVSQTINNSQVIIPNLSRL